MKRQLICVALRRDDQLPRESAVAVDTQLKLLIDHCGL